MPTTASTNSDKHCPTVTDMPDDLELVAVLDGMIERDEDITVRAVARLHPRIRHASSFTRDANRMKTINAYAEKQTRIRGSIARSKKRSIVDLGKQLGEKDEAIKTMSAQIEALVGSHLAMVRIVGELGGMPKIVSFFQEYSTLYTVLREAGAVDTPTERQK